MIIAAALAAAAVLPAAAVGTSRCRAPTTVTLSQRDQVEVDVGFACAPGERATIAWHQGNRCAVLTAAYVRGSMLVDRDGSRVFRLIDRDERANDLSYRDGRLEIRRHGQLVASAELKRGRCR